MHCSTLHQKLHQSASVYEMLRLAVTGERTLAVYAPRASEGARICGARLRRVHRGMV